MNQARTINTYQHHPIHSDLPLQMPNLTDREGEKMRPSMYGGVMSGPGALVTTAGTIHGTMQGTLHGELPKAPGSSRQHEHSSRPPTYQSTQSASKHGNSAQNLASFNPLPPAKANQTLQPSALTEN